LETVNYFCRNFLFPKFKFLEDGWKEILPDKKNSLYAVHAPFDDFRRSRQERYLGEGHSAFNYEEILEHEMHPQQ